MLGDSSIFLLQGSLKEYTQFSCSLHFSRGCVEGCFCKDENMVLNNGKCVPKSQCEQPPEQGQFHCIFDYLIHLCVEKQVNELERSL